MEGNTNTAVTIRDVYEVVDSRTKELAEGVKELGNKFDAVVTSNEHRFTVLEMHQASQDQRITEMGTRLDAHGKEIGALKDQQQQDEAATRALEGAKKARWSTRATIITTLCSLCIAVAAIVTLLLVH